MRLKDFLKMILFAPLRLINCWKLEIKISVHQPTSEDSRNIAIHSLEHGKILFFPELNFHLQKEETRFLSETYADPTKKNISYDPKTLEIKGARGTPSEKTQMKEMIKRFSNSA